MKILFSKNKLPLSALIRWGLKEPVSHFSVEFDGKLVFHSNLLGAHIQWGRTFRKKNDVVHELEYDMPLEQEEALYQAVLNAYDGRPYDFGALAYFAWRAVLWRFFGVAFPATNKWSSDLADQCTEVLLHLPKGEWSEAKLPRSVAITSPYQIYLSLKEAKANKSQPESGGNIP